MGWSVWAVHMGTDIQTAILKSLLADSCHVNQSYNKR